jgi:hypothetical protein
MQRREAEGDRRLDALEREGKAGRAKLRSPGELAESR